MVSDKARLQNVCLLNNECINEFIEKKNKTFALDLQVYAFTWPSIILLNLKNIT